MMRYALHVMKLPAIVIIAFVGASSLSARELKPALLSNQHAEIDAAIRKSGWFAISQRNHEKWGDRRRLMLPEIDISRPVDRADGFGASSFEEMVERMDSRGADMPGWKQASPEMAAVNKTGIVSRQTDDRKKRNRYHALLASHGVLTKPLSSKGDSPAATALSLSQETPEADNKSTSGIACSVPDVPLNQLGSFSESGDLTLPRILDFERLSNSQVLLVWQGSADKLYSVEWSDDLAAWYCDDAFLPTVGGIGTWGQTSASLKRFYRVVENNGITTTASDPAGGDGITTFGGTLTLDTDLFIATVVTHLPGGMEPSVVELYIDGERYGYCYNYTQASASSMTNGAETGNAARGLAGSYTYQCAIDRNSITSGIHTAYAKIDANYATTPGPDNPQIASAGTLRSPETTFENKITITSPRVSGFRATQDEINTGDLESPTHTTVFIEYPLLGELHHPANYFFRLQDENGNRVREWTGEVSGPGPGQLSVDWDGTDQNGVALPAGSYSMDFDLVAGGDLFPGRSIMIRNGEMPLKILALAESQNAYGMAGWGISQVDHFRPEWWSQLSSSGGPANTGHSWGPWEQLNNGPKAVIGGLQKGVGKAHNAHMVFWEPYNKNNNAQPWTNAHTTPAAAFQTGNPFNNYDLGVLIGHGVASSGGSYTRADGSTAVKPPQHYFPFIKDPATGETVWIESGNMAEKFGASGRLKWMFLVTCNYLRVGAHNNGTHDIYSSMKAVGTLPMGNGLHVLCGYTTSIDIDGKLGVALSRGLLQEEDLVDTVAQAWNFAWQYSMNSKDKEAQGHSKQIRNARSIYWPECESDTITGVAREHITTPTGPFDQSRLKETDSR